MPAHRRALSRLEYPPGTSEIDPATAQHQLFEIGSPINWDLSSANNIHFIVWLLAGVNRSGREGAAHFPSDQFYKKEIQQGDCSD
jgi:hypothetical protein